MLLGDVLSALRVWRRKPLVAGTVIATFALGAGANLAVFQMIWTVMLRPLPYPEAGQIMQVWQDNGKESRGNSHGETIDRWREANRSFESVANYRPWQVTVSDGSGGAPAVVRAGLVSAEFFDTLKAPMQFGRAFTRAETRAGEDRAIILTHGYWLRHFGGDRSIVGREIQADGEWCRVVGLLTPEFRASLLGTTAEPQVFMPISRAKVGLYALPTSRVIGRLKSGATRQQAQTDLAAIAASLPRASGTPSARVWLSPIQDEVGRTLRPALLALLAATVCVLLVACFNIANLLMAHASARQRELAIRSAMGATRARLIRQLMVESVVLSLTGGVAALAAGVALTRTMTALYPGGIPRLEEQSGHLPAIAAAFAVALGCGLLVGILPAWRVTSGNMEDWLRVGHAWMSRSPRRWADAFVTVQVALTVAVLIGAGLFLKSLMRLEATDPGFVREQVVTAALSLPASQYGKRPDQARFVEQLTQRLQTIPGVAAAGLTNSLPLRYTVLTDISFRLAGEAEQITGGRGVSGRYFQALGLQLAAGRALGPEDDGRKDVMVVNEAFVRRYLPGRVALGTQFADDRASIVGVVKDVRHLGIGQTAAPEIYFPLSKLPSAALGIAVRTRLPAAEVAAALRRQPQAIDANLALEKVMTLDEVLDADLARSRFQTILLSGFGLIALALAALGAYAVVAQSLRTRSQEFGLRRAVGAQTTDILMLVMREGMRAPLLGLALGCGLGALGSNQLTSMLDGVPPDDATVWSLALGTLGLVSLAACAWAARLAVRVHPVVALRSE